MDISKTTVMHIKFHSTLACLLVLFFLISLSSTNATITGAATEIQKGESILVLQNIVSASGGLNWVYSLQETPQVSMREYGYIRRMFLSIVFGLLIEITLFSHSML